MIGLILCAGKSIRLREETKDKPKCMVDICGKPVLEHIADHMNKHGIWRIVVNLHAFPEVVMKHFGQRFLYIYEPVPAGERATLAFVKSWFPGEPILMMNGDTITNIDIDRIGQGVRCISKETKLHIGTTLFSADTNETSDLDFKCEYFDIGDPEGLLAARKHYVE